MKEGTKFFREGGGETGVPVADDVRGDPIMREDVLGVVPCHGRGAISFITGDEKGGLGAVVIGDGQDGVKTIGKGELDDEVHGNNLEREGGRISDDRVEGGLRSGGKWFRGLADGAAFDIGSDEGAKLGPPVVKAEEGGGFKSTRVSSSGGVMVEGGHPPS
jgi:hypothetical protein